MSRASVFEWIAKYREGGPAAISTKIASGRPTALDDSEMIRPYAMISGKDPRTRGFGMALWSGALIQGEPQSHLCWSWGVFAGRVQAENGQEQVRVVFDLPDGGSYFGVARAADQPDREVTESGHDAGPGCGPDPGRVLAERDITDPVDLVLDAPVASDVAGQVLRGGLARRQAGDAQGGHRGPDGHGLVLAACGPCG